MKQILTFVVILLTTFSIVNALNVPLRKRATTFATCPGDTSPAFDMATVDPDPPVAGKDALLTLNINATPKDIAKASFVTDLLDDTGASLGGPFPKTEDGCGFPGVKCPIPAGSGFQVSYPVGIPKDAPATYTIQVTLSDDATGDEIACSSGPVTAAAPPPPPAGGGGGGGGGPPPAGGGAGGGGPPGPPGPGGPGGGGPPPAGKGKGGAAGAGPGGKGAGGGAAGPGPGGKGAGGGAAGPGPGPGGPAGPPAGGKRK